MQRVEIHQEFPADVSKVFAELSDHDRLGQILRSPIRRIVAGTGPSGPNGVGSVRVVGPGPLGFEETVVTCELDRLIEYKVTKGGPIKDHLGRMEFSPTPGGGCALHYVITFDGKLPGVGPLVRAVLQKGIGDSLARYAASLRA